MNRLSSLTETRENFFGMVQMGKTLRATESQNMFYVVKCSCKCHNVSPVQQYFLKRGRCSDREIILIAGIELPSSYRSFY
jgi:hypothetical protein